MKNIAAVILLILPCYATIARAATDPFTTASPFTNSTTAYNPTTLKPSISPECSSYKFLSEPDRSQTYNKSSPVLCDVRVLGWYRFGGGAGNQMPESCVSVGHCGTHAPGWLNGSHPSVADGAVKRKVCFHWPSFCCLFQLYITVRNCGAFYVYKLIPPRICDSRYCGNGLSPTTDPTEKPTSDTTTSASQSSTTFITKEFSSSTPMLLTPTQCE